MPKFTDLEAASTSQDPVKVNFADLPDQFSSFEDLPQPGKGYVFKMQPVSLEDDIWTEEQTNEGPRVAVSFDPKKNKGLVIQASPTNKYVGQQIRARVSNKERNWEGNEAGAASDMAYLIRACKGQDLTEKPSMEYANEIVRLSKAGSVFRADLEFTAQCNPKNDIYATIKDEQTGEEHDQVVEGTKGCGQRYAMKARRNRKTGELTKQIPRNGDGNYAQRFPCANPSCHAIISSFVNLLNYQPVE